MTGAGEPVPLQLTRSGVSLVVSSTPSGAPAILHWGAALGDTSAGVLDDLVALQLPGRSHSALDTPHVRGLVAADDGFTGLPALEGQRPRPGRPWAPRLRGWSWTVDDDHDDDARVSFVGQDDEAGWEVAVILELTTEGLVRLRTSVTNLAPDDLLLHAVRSALPVAPRAGELLDLSGRWCRERTPQRRSWSQGIHLRQGRHGRTGHDATLLLAAGTPGFGFGTGEVWATHVAWSGDHESYAERTPEGECVLGGGELLGPGEVRLAEGQTYDSPWLVGSWSPAGLDSVGDRLTQWVRRRRGGERRRPRPVLINTWEAVYFDHDLARLTALADVAAGVGVERFVLDDGWFKGRRDDRAGLGDWTVDPEVWPEGLHPLVDHVRGLGMEFGLWVEPEMISVDSDLARTHPDWILRGRRELPPEWRHQQVLDLQVPAAYAHVRDALLALLADYDIAFLKWDHNRDLVDVAHEWRPPVHGQTVAFYRLLDELRSSRPEVEIESCASGGGRIDMEVLTRVDRVWPSDTIDALERQRIQRWTSLVVPPEMLGTHIGPPVAHTTGRSLGLDLRGSSALIGHLGIEWDLTAASEAERAEVAHWVGVHKRMRPVLATGSVVRTDHPDPALSVTGVVGPVRDEAWFVVAILDLPATQRPAPVQLPGLDPDRTYTVAAILGPGQRHLAELSGTWVAGPGRRATGATLASLGTSLPALVPGSALVLHVQAVSN